MTTTGIAIGQLSEAEHSRQLRRAIVASTVGTIIEAYDFLLYVLVAPLVFAKLYFPESDPLVGILQDIASFWNLRRRLYRPPGRCGAFRALR